MALRTKQWAAAAGAVDKDFIPGPVDNYEAFELIDVVVTFNAAPTTSEALTVKTITPGSLSVTEYTVNPSLYPYSTYVIEIGKAYEAGTAVGVDFANTDNKTVTVAIRYREMPGE